MSHVAAALWKLQTTNERANDMSEPLTDQQVENWRRILTAQLGPYALIMTREQIQEYRDRLQALAYTANKSALDDADAQPLDGAGEL
jgi:hypothetical protein